MRLALTALALCVLGFAGEASAAGRFGTTTSRGYYSSPSYSTSRSYSYSGSNSNDFLYRGYNPGHIFGNTVRRMYWGPSMGPYGR